MKVTIDEETNSLIKQKSSKVEETTNKENNLNQKIKYKNERNSSFEILRIISMFFIILSHILFHTKSLPKLSAANFKRIINNRYIFLRIISNYGQLGDIIFAMISGFFSIKRTIFHYNKFIQIVAQVYFYHYLFLYISFKLQDIYKDIEPLQQKRGSYYMPLFTSLGHWFAQQYLVLLIFMPYINTGLLSLSQQQYKNLVILLIMCFSIIRPLLNCLGISTNLFSLILFLKMTFSYIIGGYLRICDIRRKLLIIIFGFLSFIMTIDLEILCDNFAIYYNTYLWIIIQEEFSLGICSIYGVLSGIGFIILVKDINFYNKTINFISSSTFGIYLIHANKNISPFIYNAWLRTNDYNEDYFFIKYFLKAFIIFFVCLLIDIVRRFTIGIFVDKIMIFFNNLFMKK